MANPQVIEMATGSGNGANPAAGSVERTLFLDAPGTAARIEIPVLANQVIGAQFPAEAAKTEIQGHDLVLIFENGGAIVLEAFLAAADSGEAPSLVFEDGTIYAAPDQAAANDAVLNTQVASGPATKASGSGDGSEGGSHAYEDDFGGLQLGLRATAEGFDPSTLSTGFNTPAPLNGQSPVPDAPSSADLPQAQAPAAPIVTANRAPTGITLSNASVEELPLAGIPVGFAAAIDPDAGDSHTYALIDNAAGRFVIDATSGLIRTAAVLDFETAPSHTIVVRATDSAGASVDSPVTINVLDVNEVLGTGGPDIIPGTAQTDVIDGLGGDDVINGYGGNDILFGNAGRDNLYGGDGIDVLFGESENDFLDGGLGADQLFGGSGNDSLLIDAEDTVVDGGPGIDRVDVMGAAGVNLNLTQSSIELAFGGIGEDTLDATGSTTGVRIDGGGGNDTLTGGNAADRLRGEAGDDVLFGGAGGDLLEGGSGNNTLTGGAGADVFAINLSFAGGNFTAEGNDTIVDFSTGDVLSFRGVIDDNGDTNVDLADLFGHVTVASAGSTTTLSFDGGGVVTLQNMAGGPFADLGDLTAAGFTVEGIA
jgi:hypothetical protein